MATDLLLANPLFLSQSEAERELMSPYFPLGLLYLAASVREHHFSVAVFDGTFANDESAFATKAVPGKVTAIPQGRSKLYDDPDSLLPDCRAARLDPGRRRIPAYRALGRQPSDRKTRSGAWYQSVRTLAAGHPSQQFGRTLPLSRQRKHQSD